MTTICIKGAPQDAADTAKTVMGALGSSASEAEAFAAYFARDGAGEKSISVTIVLPVGFSSKPGGKFRPKLSRVE